MKEDYDGAEPTPNSVAVRNLWRMGNLLNNDVLLDHARHAVRALAPRLEAHPFAMPFLLVSAAMLKLPPVHLIIHSPGPAHPALGMLLAEARRCYLPQMVVILVADQASRDFFAPRHPTIQNLPTEAAEPAAYLCENFTCRLPVTRPDELRQILASL